LRQCFFGQCFHIGGGVNLWKNGFGHAVKKIRMAAA
jgi:hypothetical protein